MNKEGKIMGKSSKLIALAVFIFLFLFTYIIFNRSTSWAAGTGTLRATAIECSSESDLPDLANTNTNITSTTASSYISAHPNCHLASGWSFQWYQGGTSSRNNYSDSNHVGSLGAGWTTFGPTGSNGVATSTVPAIDKMSIRLVPKANYFPFTLGPISAEMYCADDGRDFDNLEQFKVVSATTYDCVSWSVPTAVDPGKVVDTLPAGLSSSDITSKPADTVVSGNKLTWNSIVDSLSHTIIFRVKISSNYCSSGGPGSGPMGANTVLLLNSIGDTLASATDQTTSSPINITCPFKVSGDAGGSSVGGQITMSGPSIITSSGSIDPSIVQSSDVKQISSYDLGNLKQQMQDTVTDLNKLLNQSAVNFSNNDLNPNKVPGGGIVEYNGDLTLNNTLSGSGTLVVSNGNIHIGSNFSTNGGAVAIVALNGNIIIDNSPTGRNIQNVGLFAPNGTITINNNAGTFSWSGFMVAKGVIVNQQAGSAGGNISWSGLLATQTPPGFKNLLNKISVNEIAPQ
jgi:hypothetical protein